MRIPETPRLVLTLTVAGLLSGLAIVSAYRVTLPKIRANQAAALREAVFQVLPGSVEMQRLAWQDGALAVATGEDSGAEDSVYAGYDAEGRFVGYAIPSAGAGFQDTIKLIYGYDPDGRKIVGMQILESRETPGLGDRIFKDPAFVAEFSELAVDPQVVLVKGKGTAPNEVDAITGATISSAAVVKIVGSGNETWLDRLPPAASAPPFAEPAGGATVPADVDRGGPIPGGRGE